MAPKTPSKKQQRADRRHQLPNHLPSSSSTLVLDPSIPPTHFQLFPTLPLALRLKIWKLSLPPRHPPSLPASAPVPAPTPTLIPKTTTLTTRPKQREPKTKPLQHFHLFPLLPLDLRILIWEFTLPPPKTHYLKLMHTITGRPFTSYIQPSQTPSKSPVAWVSEPDNVVPSTAQQEPLEKLEQELAYGRHLLINFETRDFFLSKYEKTNTWDRFKSWRAETWGWRRVWLDRDSDLVFFNEASWRFLAGEEKYNLVGGVFVKDSVRRLAVAVTAARVRVRIFDVDVLQRRVDARNRSQILQVLGLFGGLKELSLVIDGKFKLSYGGGLIVSPTVGRDNDFFVNDGRRLYLAGFENMVGRLRLEFPGMTVPVCNVKLFIHNPWQGARIKWDLWDYFHGTAVFTD